MRRKFRMRLYRSNHLLLWVALCAALFTPGALGQAPPQSPGQKVMAQMIEALGGQAFLDVKEIQISGRYFTFRRDEVVVSDLYADFIKFPDMERTEFGKDKQKSIQINKGDKGWLVGGKNGKEVQEQPIGQIEDVRMEWKTSFDHVTRFVLNAPKTSVLLTGAEVADFRRSDVVEVRDAEKNLFRFYVDRVNHLPVKMQVRRVDDSVLYEVSFANWHKFQGIPTALFVTKYRNGAKTMEIRAEKVAYNPGFPDTLFAPPATNSK